MSLYWSFITRYDIKILNLRRQYLIKTIYRSSIDSRRQFFTMPESDRTKSLSILSKYNDIIGKFESKVKMSDGA